MFRDRCELPYDIDALCMWQIIYVEVTSTVYVWKFSTLIEIWTDDFLIIINVWERRLNCIVKSLTENHTPWIVQEMAVPFV